MPLYVIATPIGNAADISLRARETVRTCDAIIGEEHKNASRLLKACEALTAEEFAAPRTSWSWRMIEINSGYFLVT